MVFRFILFGFLFFFSICEGAPRVLVSIAPQKYLVDRIAQGKVDVIVLVPPGASPHSYEPSMRQMMEACQAKLWFRIGEGFEVQAKGVFSPYMTIIDLRDGISLLPLACGCCERDAHDSHTWLSPKRLTIQTDTVKKALQELLPEEASFFDDNAQKLKNDLQQLDQDILKMLPASSRTILVSHPAFGYFCKDYGFQQLSIEVEGKEPSVKQVSILLAEARQKGISKVYLQPQYSKKGAERIAQELKASIEVVDPYQENVIENLRTLATQFSS